MSKHNYVGKLQNEVIKHLKNNILTFDELRTKLEIPEKNLYPVLRRLLIKGTIKESEGKYTVNKLQNISIIREVTQKSIVIPVNVREVTQIGDELLLTNLSTNESIRKIREKANRISLRKKLNWNTGDKIEVQWI